MSPRNDAEALSDQIAGVGIDGRPVDKLGEVYGIRKISFDEKERTVRIEYDATRLNDDIVAGILRRAGLDLKEKIALAI